MVGAAATTSNDGGKENQKGRVTGSKQRPGGLKELRIIKVLSVLVWVKINYALYACVALFAFDVFNRPASFAFNVYTPVPPSPLRRTNFHFLH